MSRVSLDNDHSPKSCPMFTGLLLRVTENVAWIDGGRRRHRRLMIDDDDEDDE